MERAEGMGGQFQKEMNSYAENAIDMAIQELEQATSRLKDEGFGNVVERVSGLKDQREKLEGIRRYLVRLCRHIGEKSETGSKYVVEGKSFYDKPVISEGEG